MKTPFRLAAIAIAAAGFLPAVSALAASEAVIQPKPVILPAEAPPTQAAAVAPPTMVESRAAQPGAKRSAKKTVEARPQRKPVAKSGKAAKVKPKKARG